MTDRPAFYCGTKNASSWSLRAWLALREAGLAFDEIEVDLRRPQRLEHLARIRAFSPPGAVPVLVAGDSCIFDSLAIMEYASDTGVRRLLPDDPRQRAEARAWLAWQHAGLSGLCPELSFESVFYPERRALTVTEHGDIHRLADAWDGALAESGGPYLVGGELSLPDLAFVPTILRIQAYRPDLSSYPRVQYWMDEMNGLASLEEWLEQARKLPPVYLS